MCACVCIKRPRIASSVSSVQVVHPNRSFESLLSESIIRILASYPAPCMPRGAERACKRANVQTCARARASERESVRAGARPCARVPASIRLSVSFVVHPSRACEHPPAHRLGVCRLAGGGGGLTLCLGGGGGSSPPGPRGDRSLAPSRHPSRARLAHHRAPAIRDENLRSWNQDKM